MMAQVTFATKSEVASPTAKPGTGQAMNIFPFHSLLSVPQLLLFFGGFFFRSAVSKYNTEELSPALKAIYAPPRVWKVEIWQGNGAKFLGVAFCERFGTSELQTKVSEHILYLLCFNTPLNKLLRKTSQHTSGQMNHVLRDQMLVNAGSARAEGPGLAKPPWEARWSHSPICTTGAPTGVYASRPRPYQQEQLQPVTPTSTKYPKSVCNRSPSQIPTCGCAFSYEGERVWGSPLLWVRLGGGWVWFFGFLPGFMHACRSRIIKNRR